MRATTKRSTTPLIRLAHPQAFAAFLQSVGSPTDRLFRRVGLPVYCDDPTVFVPLRRAWALFDAAAQLEDPALGWHVGRFYGDNRLSTGLLQKIEHAPTLYRALYQFARLISAEASHLQLGILERPDEIVFYTRYTTIKNWPGYLSSQSYQLEAFLDLIRHYAEPDWVPREVGIESPTVPAVAAEHFAGSRVRPNQRMGYVTVPRTCLHLPPRSVDPPGARQKSMVLTQDFDYVDTLKAVVEAYVPDGYPSARKTAALMDTSVRSLFRRLSERGLTYQGLIDEVRFKKAKDLLQAGDVLISDVSGSVGFNNPTHFSRMFRRISGLSPQEYLRSVAV